MLQISRNTYFIPTREPTPDLHPPLLHVLKSQARQKLRFHSLQSIMTSAFALSIPADSRVDQVSVYNNSDYFA